MRAGIAVLLMCGTFVIFGPVRDCDFLNYDDDGYVTANPHVQQGLTPAGVRWAFQTGETANWHPLTWLSLMADAEFHGVTASGFHLTNLVLHVANSILLFMVLFRLTGSPWPGVFVSALFAWHPLHVESVAWVAERKDVLSGLFFMLTLFCYAGYGRKKSTVHSPESTVQRERTTGDSRRWTADYLLALFFFACGLMSKPMLVTTPFVLLLLDFWPLGRIQLPGVRNLGGMVLEKAPFLVLSIISSVITFEVQQQGRAVQTLETFPIGDRIGNAVVSYARYLGKCFWPVDLALPYPYIHHWPAIIVLMAAVLVVAASVLAVRFAGKFPFLLVGWFWFAGMLLPVIGLIQVGTQSMADRYTYLPLIGIFLMAGVGAEEIIRRRRLSRFAAAISAMIILGILGWLTREQIGYWRDTGVLFRHAIAVTRDNAEAYEHLGTYYVRIGERIPEAESCYRRSVEIDPERITARVDLGSILLLEQKTDEALEQFREALRIAPDNATANCDAGYALAASGRFDEAIPYYRKAIGLKPDFASAYHDLGLAFAAKEDWDQAIFNYQQAIHFDPGHASTHTHLGIAWLHRGKTDQAAAEFRETLRLNPADREAEKQLESLQPQVR